MPVDKPVRNGNPVGVYTTDADAWSGVERSSPAEDVCVCGADRRQAREEPAETAIAVRSDVVSCPGSVQCMSCLAVERGTLYKYSF